MCVFVCVCVQVYVCVCVCVCVCVREKEREREGVNLLFKFYLIISDLEVEVIKFMHLKCEVSVYLRRDFLAAPSQRHFKLGHTFFYSQAV